MIAQFAATAVLDDIEDTSPDNCAACRKKLEKQAAAHALESTKP